LHLPGAVLVQFGQCSLRVWLIRGNQNTLLHQTNCQRPGVSTREKDKTSRPKMF